MSLSPITAAHLAALDAFTERYRGTIMTPGTFQAEEWSRLYTAWICARWDDGDPWVRSVWIKRPTDGA